MNLVNLVCKTSQNSPSETACVPCDNSNSTGGSSDICAPAMWLGHTGKSGLVDQNSIQLQYLQDEQQPTPYH